MDEMDDETVQQFREYLNTLKTSPSRFGTNGECTKQDEKDMWRTPYILVFRMKATNRGESSDTPRVEIPHEQLQQKVVAKYVYYRAIPRK
jgi:hypothetical protein